MIYPAWLVLPPFVNMLVYILNTAKEFCSLYLRVAFFFGIDSQERTPRTIYYKGIRKFYIDISHNYLSSSSVFAGLAFFLASTGNGGTAARGCFGGGKGIGILLLRGGIGGLPDATSADFGDA